MDDESWKAIEKAAESRGQTISDFIRDVLLRAARRSKGGVSGERNNRTQTALAGPYGGL
jgi:hypothetical protein